MSYKEETGQHRLIFATKEQISEPSTIKLPEAEKPAGLILEDGSINWNCPCLGGMVAGPCGVPFRQAFSCFHYSEAEPKGSDCMEAFSKMQECMQQYPKLYGPSENDDDIFDLEQTEKESERTKINKDHQKSSIENDSHKPVTGSIDENKLGKMSDKT